MSLFNTLLASVGIGSAKVDTRLHSSSVRVGGKLEGVVHLQGGSAEQQVDSIYLHLMTQYLKEQGDTTARINTAVRKWKLSEPRTLRPGQQEEVPFSFEVPLNTPVTFGRVPVWLKTGLDIDSAVDPGDSDKLEVLPHPHMQAVLDAVASLGFHPKESTCEYSSHLGRGVPFVQEFEFYPAQGFRGVRELELAFVVERGGVEVLVEVDRRVRGFTGLLGAAMDLNERKRPLRFSAAELGHGRQALADRLASIIEVLAG